MELPIIQQRIYEIRGLKVMLDFDLAVLYDVETKVFKQAVKRNISRFPRQFALNYKGLADEIQEIRQTVESHSEQLVKIYGAIETLLVAKEARESFADRERIGFK